MELLFAVVPDMREQLLIRIPEPLPVAFNLHQRLIVMAHRRQKRRGAIETVGPHLRRAEDVVEDAVRVARRLVPNPVEQALDGIADLRVSGPLGGLA